MHALEDPSAYSEGVRKIVFACILLSAAPAHAEDWPQFRGPTGQGHSSERRLPLEWSPSHNIAWKVPIAGVGWSSPVVADGRVWLTTAVGDSLRALAFDEASGRMLVDAEVFHVPPSGAINPKNSRATPTPIVEGERVYVHFGADGTAALSTAGEILWTTRLEYESQHGSGGSPVLYRDLLIVVCDGNGGEAYVVALDTGTGKVRWKTDRRRPADQAYATPLIIRAGDRDLLVAPGAHRAAAYDPLTGEEVWRVGYPNGFSNVPRPVYGDGRVFIATGFNTPSIMAVRADGRGDVTQSHVEWTSRRGAPLTPSPILVGTELYFVSDTGVLSCVDAASGTYLWQERIGGNYSASPVFADGRIYFLNEEGIATVIAPGRTFERLATNTLDGPILASIAVSNGALFIRSGSYLYRIAQR